jgi:hypothetical protein
MAPKLIGTEKLPKFNVQATDMALELERVFNKYENLFDMNKIGTSEDDEHLKANLLRQYISDAVLAAIRPVGND